MTEPNGPVDSGLAVGVTVINTILGTYFSILADSPLKVDDLLASFVQPFAFALHQLLAFFGGRVVEARLGLRLLIFQGEVTGHDFTIFQDVGHVRVAGSVVHYQTIDELGFLGTGHAEDFDPVQIDGLIGALVHALNRTDSGI